MPDRCAPRHTARCILCAVARCWGDREEAREREGEARERERERRRMGRRNLCVYAAAPGGRERGERPWVGMCACARVCAGWGDGSSTNC